MSDKSMIPQFTGVDYRQWAFKVKFGLADKKLHNVVLQWGGVPGQGRLVIPSIMSQAEEDEIKDAGGEPAAAR